MLERVGWANALSAQHSMRYRRANIPGAAYFFTVNLADRKSCLLTAHIDVLRNAMRKIRQSHPFDIIAMVVLPDHLHAIWRLPEGDANFPLRWSLIKAAFSRAIPKTEVIRRSRKMKRERGIWQRRYWEHQHGKAHSVACLVGRQ